MIALGTAQASANGDLTAYQIWRPATDVTTAGWAVSAGTDFFDAVNEFSASDADFITSPNLSFSSAPIEFGLAPSALPPENYVVRVRARRAAYFEQIRASLLDGSGVVVGVSPWHDLLPGYAQYNLQVSTNVSAARVRIEGRLDGFADLAPGALFLGDSPVRLGNDVVSLA